MNFPELNFPERYQFKITSKNSNYFIYDIIRKKKIVLTPEEWVRQHWLHYICITKNVNAIRVQVEQQIEINKTYKRFDIVVRHKNKVQIIIECKSPEVKINEKTFEQIARYNLVLQANYIVLSNGLHHVAFTYNTEHKHYIPIILDEVFFFN